MNKAKNHKSVNTKILFLPLLIFVSFLFSLLPNSQAQAQLVKSPAVNLTIEYVWSGIAGPERENPDVFDELPYPVYLLNERNEIEYVSYSKLNVNDNPGRLSVARARWENVQSGVYKACLPLEAPPVDIEEFECTDPFVYQEGVDLDVDLRLNREETLRVVESTLVFDVNGLPCAGSNIGWILCPLVEGFYEVIESLFNDVFTNLLELDPLFAEADDGTPQAVLFDIWNNFRIIATVLFVILFLVAVFAQSLGGFQVFSAYDLKKMLPRLVIAAIAIQLSWYMVGFMVDVFNILGSGVRGLIASPVEGFDRVEFDASRAAGNITLAVASGGLIITGLIAGGFLGVILLVPIAFVSIMLAVIFGVFVLLLRNTFIILGIALSPVAFALWVLPNTQGMFMFWWNTMWRLLIMYPLIIALLAIGELASKVTVAGHENDLVWNLAGLVILFAPFFAIPYTFRVAQNVLGSVTSGLDGQRQRLNQRLFGDPEDPYSYRGRRAAYKSRYATQRHYNRVQKSFKEQNKGKTTFFGRKWLPRPKFLQTSGRTRTSWRPGYQTHAGTTEYAGKRKAGIGRRGQIYSPPATGGGLRGRLGRARAYDWRGAGGEGWGSYLRSLPRFALRTPGRVYARGAARYGAMTGLIGIDEMQGVRNREARKRMLMMSKSASRDAFAHAIFGDYNLFNGKKLDADVIAAARRFRNDDAAVQENMKWLFEKAAAIPFRRQWLIDHWMGVGHPMLPDDVRYFNEKLEPYLYGEMKGVSFGTQKIYRDNKHRVWTTEKRMPTRSERQDHKRLEDIDKADRKSKDFAVGMGRITDDKSDGALNEAVNLMLDGQIAGFSGTNFQMYSEIGGRWYDIIHVEADEIKLDLLQDPEHNQTELRKLKQGTALRTNDGTVQTDSDGKFVQAKKGGHFVFDDDGEIIIKGYDIRKGSVDNPEGADATSQLSDERVREGLVKISRLVESTLDTIAQGDIGIEVGDDDTPGALKPETGASGLYSRWRKPDIAEYLWVQEYAKAHNGTEPTNEDKKKWRTEEDPATGETKQEEFLRTRQGDVQDEQNDRIKVLLTTASHARMSPLTLESAKDFVEDNMWLLDERKLKDLDQKFRDRGRDSLIGDIDRIIK